MHACFTECYQSQGDWILLDSTLVEVQNVYIRLVETCRAHARPDAAILWQQCIVARPMGSLSNPTKADRNSRQNEV
jgi:hypothetical protein